MSDLTFARPWILLALVALPVLASLWGWGARRARRRSRPLTRQQLPGPRHLAAVLFLLAAGLAVVAGAQPQWGQEQSRVPRTGADLIVVLDVSRSMEARDLQPSRMEATKAMLQTLLGRLGGDRVGMVIFGGDARLRFPLTTDLAAASQVVATIETGPRLVDGGSSAAAGLSLALDSFDDSSDANRVILLITDGDDLGEDPASISRRLAESGVELLVAGVGTAEGAPVPVFDPASSTYSDKVDAEGNTIISRLNEGFLRALATASEGRYLGSNLSGVPGAVAGRLVALERTRFEEEARPIPIERYQWFAGAALAVVVVASLAEWLPRPSRRTVVAGVAVGASLLMGCATRAYELNEEGLDAYEAADHERAIALFLEAQAESPDDPRVRLNLAAAYHQAGRFEEANIAARTLLVEGEAEVRARAHASIGHHQFAAGNLPAALDAFRQALLEDPDDRDSRHDYEVVLRLLTRPEEEPPEPGGPREAPGTSTQPAESPGEGTPTAGAGASPGETLGPSRPGSAQEIERRLDDLDAEIARLIEEAGDDPDAAEAFEILRLLAERQRIASLREALNGGGDPRDY